jgi:prophage regulatory protein
VKTIPFTGGKLPLMGTAEIRRRFGGISAQRVNEIVKKPTFPEPVADLDMGRIWYRPAVEAWIAEHREDLNEADA